MGFRRLGVSERDRAGTAENKQGSTDQDEPPGSVKPVSLQDQIERWVSRGLARLMSKLLARALGSAGPGTAPSPPEPPSAVPLHRDPWCGTYVSPEISFPLEQSGQVLHFCSAECRARYERSSQRAAHA